MTDASTGLTGSDSSAELAARAREFGVSRPGRVDVVSDDARGWLALEETQSTFAFAEVEGGQLRILPFLGDADQARQQPFVRSIEQSWLEGSSEIVILGSSITDSTHISMVESYLEDALEHWRRSVAVASPAQEVEREATGGTQPGVEASAPTVARLSATVSPEWSWASAHARIPQIADIVLELAEPAPRTRLIVTLRDADIIFGSTVVHDGMMPSGALKIGEVHVPLSARVMSQVDDRRGATCEIVLEIDGQVVARVDEAVDVQPRDLWNWAGDPLRAEQRRVQGRTLARSLLASFVRPNHPAVAGLAREAAGVRGKLFGEESFHAFQLRDSEARSAVEQSITAIYDAIRGRGFAYSEPPPGWDYSASGQRIRDHGEVAAGGLATCMDSTVLMAAVIEDVGLHPLLVLVSGHIFIGYWLQDPQNSGRAGSPDWYPREAVTNDVARIVNLVEARYLGLIETTALAVGASVSADQARAEARKLRFASAVREGNVTLIDVAAARQLGVSPLPAVIERADGATEVLEYRVNAPAVVTVVDADAPESVVRERHVDSHPPRYRTWKSSLFSLNATNALLNLGRNARVQPLVLPASNLGELEDMLNQDRSFTVRSGFDLPEVWRARGDINAFGMLQSNDPQGEIELVSAMRDRVLYAQRVGLVKGEQHTISGPVTVRELRSMAHNSKTAREERGMNPLYLCFGILRWDHSPGKQADAPLILVPVNLVATRGGRDFTLSLDATQQTTTNAALIEWLRREHGLTIPGLTEPIADRAGIDVDAVLAEVRNALLGHTGALKAQVLAEARLATLDLSAFRMWQDLNTHADLYLQRPLIRHLVETPTEQFVDAAATASSELTAEDLEALETPIPADSTQKRAVLWAAQGRTFVLQGPPGTGKSQTITNMVAESVLAGMRVLFVAEKGTALAVVQRRLDAIGLTPFTLSLHHEGSNSVEVRASLQRAITASVTPDAVAMENARRRLRNARFELAQYPEVLHSRNAAGHSAYSARDELLVLGDGRTVAVSSEAVAHRGEALAEVSDAFRDLQRWTSAAGVRTDHPWRFAGVGAGDPFDVDVVRASIQRLLEAADWREGSDELQRALQEVTHPKQLETLVAGAHPTLPSGEELSWVFDAEWLRRTPETVGACEQSVESWRPRLHGFSYGVIDLDLAGVVAALEVANSSSFLGRKNRQAAAIAPLVAMAPTGLEVSVASAPMLLADLIAAKDASAQVRAAIASLPGLLSTAPSNAFAPGVLEPARARVVQLVAATGSLRHSDAWTLRVKALAIAGHLDGHREMLASLAGAWESLCRELLVRDDDLAAWVGGESLLRATLRHTEAWKQDIDYNRLLALQQWCALARRLECMRDAGLEEARSELLEGRLNAETAEDALARGIGRAALEERIRAAGLDRFDAVAHDHRAASYVESQSAVRTHWITDAPSRLLASRGAGGKDAHAGGLARELAKTTRRLGTRAILRKYGDAVQSLTPLVLASPASVVDLIDPQLMEFDLVIFDEASQITVPEAIGALGRARAAVVVGDSKQMPPTRLVGGGAIEEEVEDVDVDEILEDQESILSESELASVPALSLNWHYRSQDEQLIAFSNQQYYKGELSSFPTPTLLSSETGIEFRRVALPPEADIRQARGYRAKPAGYLDGHYLRAGSKAIDLGGSISAGANTNPAEAFAIVDAVRELIATAGERKVSIGIVTFNERQRELIEDLLIASNEQGIRDAMDEQKMGRSDVLFVKALEQVQGDERDVIIFSVAFSKQANGKIPTNFGPLSNNGGERRLNVAITRARRKDIVFCSFDPSELDVEGSQHDGPKHFKAFLVDAARASGDGSGAPGRVAIRDRHRDDIAEALRAAGLHVMSDVGMSNFRLDLVLARADAPEQPLLPVLLDGESWTRRATVSDRDVLPLEVLRDLMGWPAVARIWWPMWMQNRELVIAQILEQVDAAEASLASRAASSVGNQQVLVDAAVTPNSEVLEESFATIRGVMTPQPPTHSREPEPEPARAEAAELMGAPITAPTVEPDGLPAPAVMPQAADQSESATQTGVFAPAHANVVAPRDVLDELPRRSAAAQVREQILDVIESEGPVEIARLTRIVAKRFGLNAVRAARAEEIVKLVPRDRLNKSRLGTFAWPEYLSPETWRGYRSADEEGSRTLEEVAPEEIANAMRAVRQLAPRLDEDGVLRRTAEIFGITRLGALVKSRLAAVYERLCEEPS